jgi:hypothetical protein
LYGTYYSVLLPGLAIRVESPKKLGSSPHKFEGVEGGATMALQSVRRNCLQMLELPLASLSRHQLGLVSDLQEFQSSKVPESGQRALAFPACPPDTTSGVSLTIDRSTFDYYHEAYEQFRPSFTKLEKLSEAVRSSSSSSSPSPSSSVGERRIEESHDVVSASACSGDTRSDVTIRMDRPAFEYYQKAYNRFKPLYTEIQELSQLVRTFSPSYRTIIQRRIDLSPDLVPTAYDHIEKLTNRYRQAANKLEPLVHLLDTIFEEFRRLRGIGTKQNEGKTRIGPKPQSATAKSSNGIGIHFATSLSNGGASAFSRHVLTTQGRTIHTGTGAAMKKRDMGDHDTHNLGK